MAHRMVRQNGGGEFDDTQVAATTTGSQLTIEWDPSIVYGNEQPYQIGSITWQDFMATMTTNAKWHTSQQPIIQIRAVDASTPDLKLQLPPQYHWYMKMFETETADQLPGNKAFDHAVDLEPGEVPPLGPVL